MKATKRTHSSNARYALQFSHGLESGNPVWKVEPLVNVVEILDSGRVPVNGKERGQRQGDVPYYGATGQVGWIDDHLFNEELVLLGEDGAPFLDPARTKAYLIRGKSWVNNHAHVLRAKPGLLNSFLLYQLNRLDYRPYVSGTTRLKLPQGPMRQIPIVVLHLDEQRRIVADLETQLTRLDASVTALKRVQANLKRYRASVLKAACEGRLVPTEAELARCEGGSYESGASLLEQVHCARLAAVSGTKKIKSAQELNTNGLPELPEGWAWARLDALAALKGGITVDKKRRDETARTVPYLRVANVQRGYLDLSEVKEINAPAADVEDLRLVPGDVLFNEGGDRDKLGRGWIWEGQLPDCIHQNHVFRARLYLADLSSKLLSWWGNSFGRDYFLREGKQTTNLASINLGKLSAFPVPVPPLAEQRRIVAEVERRLSVIEELEATVVANLRRGERLRQSVLARAFAPAP